MKKQRGRQTKSKRLVRELDPSKLTEVACGGHGGNWDDGTPGGSN